jgi:hypothetical protein
VHEGHDGGSGLDRPFKDSGAAMADFSQAFTQTMLAEGGHVNDPQEPGDWHPEHHVLHVLVYRIQQ